MIYTIPSLPVLTSLHPERYLRTLLAVFLCSLLPIFAANLYINYVELRQDVSRINFEASLWQQKTRGLACVSHQGPYVFHQGQRPFKRLRLESELKKKKSNREYSHIWLFYHKGNTRVDVTQRPEAL